MWLIDPFNFLIINQEVRGLLLAVTFYWLCYPLLIGRFLTEHFAVTDRRL